MLLRLTRFLIKCFLYTIFRLHVHGKEHFPKEGAVIVALNHKSLWDGPLAYAVLPRPMSFMAKKELFKNPILAAILKWGGAFPVARGTSDIGAIKAALSALKAGKVMAIFPEGRRVAEGEEHTAKAGVAMIAEKTGAPVVPVAISGRYRFLSRVDLYVGEPVTIKSTDGSKLTGEQLQTISNELLAQILQMSACGNLPTKENAICK